MIPEVDVLLIVLLMAPVRSQGDVFICVQCRPSDVGGGYGALTSSWISSARTPQGCPVEQKNPEKKRDSPQVFTHQLIYGSLGELGVIMSKTFLYF